jgi:pimeloyl-ACP methyl ester carboxylesterase
MSMPGYCCVTEPRSLLALDTYRMAVEDPPGEHFVRLPIPHLYYRGTDFRPEAAEFLAKRDVPSEVFEGSGHFPMLDACDDFYQRLERWLGTLS